MNTGDLMAKLEANKKPLAIAGAAGVAGLALLQRKKAGGDVGGVSAGAAPVGAGTGSSLGSPGGQVVYSSEASDVYNAIQPQLSTIGNAMSQLLAEKSQPGADTAIPLAAQTNAQWLNQAEQGFVKNGGHARDARFLLTNYLNGADIKASDIGLVDWAVKNYGSAPEGTKGTSALV